MRLAVRMVCVLLVIVVTGCASSTTKRELRATEEDPAQANASLGLAYLQQGDYEVALAKLKRAIEINPDLPEAHHYIAEAYRQIEQLEFADEHYRRAIDLSSDNPALRNNYGVFLCAQERYKEAERQLEEAYENRGYSSRDQAYENAGLCAMRIPDTERAEKYFRSALSINPRRALSLYQMAVLKYDDGEYLKARGFLQRFHEVARYTPQSLLLGVRIERQLGDDKTLARYASKLKNEFPEADETRLLKESAQP